MNFIVSVKLSACSSLSLAGISTGKVSKKPTDRVFPSPQISASYLAFFTALTWFWTASCALGCERIHSIGDLITGGCIPNTISCFERVTTYAHWSPYIKPLSLVTLFIFSWQKGLSEIGQFHPRPISASAITARRTVLTHFTIQITELQKLSRLT